MVSVLDLLNLADNDDAPLHITGAVSIVAYRVVDRNGERKRLVVWNERHDDSGYCNPCISGKPFRCHTVVAAIEAGVAPQIVLTESTRNYLALAYRDPSTIGQFSLNLQRNCHNLGELARAPLGGGTGTRCVVCDARNISHPTYTFEAIAELRARFRNLFYARRTENVEWVRRFVAENGADVDRCMAAAAAFCSAAVRKYLAHNLPPETWGYPGAQTILEQLDETLLALMTRKRAMIERAVATPSAHRTLLTWLTAPLLEVSLAFHVIWAAQQPGVRAIHVMQGLSHWPGLQAMLSALPNVRRVRGFNDPIRTSIDDASACFDVARGVFVPKPPRRAHARLVPQYWVPSEGSARTIEPRARRQRPARQTVSVSSS